MALDGVDRHYAFSQGHVDKQSNLPGIKRVQATPRHPVTQEKLAGPAGRLNCSVIRGLKKS